VVAQAGSARTSPAVGERAGVASRPGGHRRHVALALRAAQRVGRDHPALAEAGTFRTLIVRNAVYGGDMTNSDYELRDGAVGRSRARLNAALANGGLSQSVHLAHPDGRPL